MFKIKVHHDFFLYVRVKKKKETTGERQETRDKRQEARGKRQEARDKRQEARGATKHLNS